MTLYRCPPRLRKALLAACVLLGAAGCRVNFEGRDADPTTIIDADPSTIVDADLATIIDADLTMGADAFVGPDATPTLASLRLVGSTSCSSPSSVITVTGAGLAVGSVALVHAYRRASNGTVSASDSKGNIYSEVAIAGTEGTRTHLWQAVITTALTSGDTITLTESTLKVSAVIVAELQNASPTPFSTQTGGADNGVVSMSFTSMSPGVVLCAGGNRGGIVQLEPSWTEIDTLEDDCGGGQGKISIFAHWMPAGTNGVSSCEGTFSLVDDFEQWVGAVVSYQE